MTLETVDLRRAAAALAVILLHIVVLAVLLRATIARAPKAAESRTMLLQLFVPAPPKKPTPLPPPRAIRPEIVVPAAPATITTPPPVDNAPALEGLHQSLFGCAPENLANLTPEQRAQCGRQALGPSPDETDTLRNPPSRSHDPRHWQRALARKQNPLLLPCMSSQGIGVGISTVICVGKGAISGFGDLDDGPGYGDTPPVEVHVPNNGDPVPPWSPR